MTAPNLWLLWLLQLLVLTARPNGADGDTVDPGARQALEELRVLLAEEAADRSNPEHAYTVSRAPGW